MDIRSHSISGVAPNSFYLCFIRHCIAWDGKKGDHLAPILDDTLKDVVIISLFAQNMEYHATDYILYNQYEEISE